MNKLEANLLSLMILVLWNHYVNLLLERFHYPYSSDFQYSVGPVYEFCMHSPEIISTVLG